MMIFNIISSDSQCYTLEGNTLLIENSKKLSDIIDRLPAGLIDKRATGIGATTCELNSPRNSIIVVPTRALAYTKSKSNPDRFYLGSPYGDIKARIKDADIKKYISSPIIYKKIIVVADSLPRLINIIGTSVYEDFFIMVDEIDSFQSEIDYRPKMEFSMEYFFKFKGGCLVSATLTEFSNPNINNLPRIKIDYLKREEKKLNIIYGSGSAAKSVTELIKDYYSKKQILSDFNSETKLLIAYNSVESIMEIISLLPDKLKSKCKILCSEKSKEKTIYQGIEYYDELNNSILPGQINFITSSYFVGIDINEIFCPLLINDTKIPHTFLSLEKIKQIEGRCRLKLQKTFVLFTRPTEKLENTSMIQLIRDSEAQVSAISCMISSGNISNLVGNDFKEKVEPLIDFYNPNALCKLTSINNIEVSYLSIDSQLFKQRLFNETYKSLQAFTLLAIKHNYKIQTIKWQEHRLCEIDKVKIHNYQEDKFSNIEIIKSNFISDLNSNSSYTQLQEYTSSNTGGVLFDVYKSLSYSISNNDISEYLEKYYVGATNTKKIQKLIRSYKYFQSKPTSDWKINVIKEFQIGENYTSEEILNKMRTIQSAYGTFDKSIGKIKTKSKATQLLGEFFKIKRTQKRTENDQKINLYKIVGENPMNFKVKPPYSFSISY